MLAKIVSVFSEVRRVKQAHIFSCTKKLEVCFSGYCLSQWCSHFGMNLIDFTNKVTELWLMYTSAIVQQSRENNWRWLLLCYPGWLLSAGWTESQQKIIVLSLMHPDITLSSDQEQYSKGWRWHIFQSKVTFQAKKRWGNLHALNC